MKESDNYLVKLEVFEGPLDLLMSLIEKEKVDIYDIPITSITEQYLSYINDWKELNLEIASEFLLMAATLLQIKSRMLLPVSKKKTVEENENGAVVDPRQELVDRLLEHKKIKELAVIIAEKHKERQLSYVRTKDGEPQLYVGEFETEQIEPVEPTVLLKAYFALMAKKKKLSADSNKNIIINLNEISVSHTMSKMMKKLRAEKRKIAMQDFLQQESFHKKELIAVFLATLEMLKRSLVMVFCEGNEIYLELKKKRVKENIDEH